MERPIFTPEEVLSSLQKARPVVEALETKELSDEWLVNGVVIGLSVSDWRPSNLWLRIKSFTDTGEEDSSIEKEELRPIFVTTPKVEDPQPLLVTIDCFDPSNETWRERNVRGFISDPKTGSESEVFRFREETGQKPVFEINQGVKLFRLDRFNGSYRLSPIKIGEKNVIGLTVL